MRTFVIGSAMFLAAGLAYGSTGALLDARTDVRSTTTTDIAAPTSNDDDATRALGRAILGARAAATDTCALPSLS